MQNMKELMEKMGGIDTVAKENEFNQKKQELYKAIEETKMKLESINDFEEQQRGVVSEKSK